MMLLVLSGAAFLAMPVSRASAATNIEAAYTTASIPINGVVTPGEWTATPVQISEAAGMTVTFEQNSTGLLFLMQWQSSGYCTDNYCFGGVEMGFTNTTGNMGSSSTPTIMVLVSQSFTLGYDEFVSTGEQTPTSVETRGYSTQSTCAQAISGSAYTAECYRPFTLSGATPYDPFPALVEGLAIGVGFAVGEFNQPGFHEAIGMGTYTLTLSQPPTSSTTSSTTSTTYETPTTSSATTTSIPATSTTSTATSTTSSSSTTSTSSTTTTPPVSATSTASTSTSFPTTTVVSTSIISSVSTLTTSTVSVAVSTLIQTAQAVPSWAYAIMLLLLVIGVLVGFNLGRRR